MLHLYHTPTRKYVQQSISKRPNRKNNMITVTTLIRYISIVSFVDIVVLNNHYRQRNHYGTVIIYITPSDPVVCDVADRIVQTLSSRYLVPVVLRDNNRKHSSTWRSQDEQNLSIMLFNNRSSVSKIKNISSNMWANDDKIIALVSELDESLPYSRKFVQIVRFLNRFVLIGPNSKMIAFRMFRETVDIEAYTVDMFNNVSVVDNFNKVYGSRSLSLSDKKITVFIRYHPPWALLCPKGDTTDFVYVGPDALVSELILSRLNATIIMTSDVAQYDANYIHWYEDGVSEYVKNIRFRHFHSEAISKTAITDFNAR